jgi:peroxiredoxin
MMLKPKQELPDLELSLINDTQWSLFAQESNTFTMLVFYRGLHCPICKKYLQELASKRNDFSKRGVHFIAISCDSKERAIKTGEDWDIDGLPVGFGLTIETARSLGLFISKGISEKEPTHFSEPAVFLVRPDNTLYASSIQTMPFARPVWDDILNAIDLIGKQDYPARGGE